MTRDELCRLALDFTEAFNRDDLDAVMGYFAGDGLYVEYDGRESRGKDAIRKAFEPQFRGDFGTIRFMPEDLFADAATGKAMIRWECVLERDGKRRAWRGLDLLHFEGGKVKEKHTYAKAEKPALREPSSRT